MKPTILHVDLVNTAALVTFSDGTAVLFDAEFLYAHRSEDGNRSLPDED